MNLMMLSLLLLFMKCTTVAAIQYRIASGTCPGGRGAIRACDEANRAGMCGSTPDTDREWCCLPLTEECYVWGQECTGSQGIAGDGQLLCIGAIYKNRWCCNSKYEKCTTLEGQNDICLTTFQNPYHDTSPDTASSLKLALFASTIASTTLRSTTTRRTSVSTQTSESTETSVSTKTSSLSSTSSTTTTTSSSTTTSAEATKEISITSSSPTTNATSSPEGAMAGKPSSALSGGTIGGIVVGVLAGLALVAAAAFFLGRRRHRERQEEAVPQYEESPVEAIQGDGTWAKAELPPGVVRTELPPGDVRVELPTGRY